MKKRMKRFLAILLTSAMVLNIGPMSTIVNALVDGMKALAAEDPIVVIAGSDFQNSDGDAAGGKTVTSILNQMGYSSVDGVLFGGDYSYSYSADINLTNLDGYLDDYCATADNRIYIQGNHDINLTPGSGLLDTEGSHDPESGAYGVYAINHEDFPWSNSSSTLVKGTADLLKAYLDAKAEANYKKPIFVMSHLPLHYTNRGDNDYANLLFGVLNSYDDLNIIFLFGHNHSTAYDSYLGQGSIYLKKGDAIKVAKDGATSYNDETLNFTYMNYGYTGYIGSTNADATLTMTAFEIYEDEVVVKRYSTSGQHTLKAAGGNTQLPSGVSVNSDVYGQAAINLSYGESTISEISADSGDDSTGSGDNTGTTGGSGWTYELVTSIEAGEKYVIVGNDNPVALMDNSGEMGSQSVTISGTTLTSTVALTEWTFSSASSGTITSDAGNQLGYSSSSWNLTGDGDCDFDIAVGSSNFSLHVVRNSSYYSRYYFYYDGSAWAKDSSSTQYVRLYKLTGTGSGGSTVTPEGGDWITISSGVGGTIYTLDEDGLDVGSDEKYLIVDTSANGTGNVLTNSNGTAANTTVTITDKVIVVEDDTNVAWTPTGSSTSANFANGSYNIYLSYNNGVLYTSTRSLAVTHKGDGEYTLKRSSSSSGYYVQYSSSDEWDTLSISSNSVYLFRKTGTESAGDAEYAKLVGELTYTIDRGLDSNAALAEVMNGIDVVVSGDKTAETTLEDTDENITWTLASGYDGTVAGEYAVTISYKGVKLGTAKVIVPAVNVEHIACDESGSVKAGATGNVRTGAYITVFYEDDTTQKIPVTLNMLKDADGNAVDTTLAEDQTSKTITGLKVYYNGECVCENFTLTVREPSPYPEYPDEGAVKVDKTATGVQFQSTGVAQVELSASGIPMNQGVDVLLVLDTSSSMGFDPAMLNGRTRIDVLRECVNALIKNLKAERTDGSVPDVDISIVHFNGYYDNKEVNYIDDPAKNTSTLGSVLADWDSVQNMSDTWASNIPGNCSGTNYDHGLQMAYDQLQKKQEKDGDSRKQFVLFMSDGAPFQYNGVTGNSITAGSDWSKWILGSLTQEEVKVLAESTSNAHKLSNPEFYYGNNNGNGQKNWLAEAIKGDTDKRYKVPSYSDTTSSATGLLIEVPGLGATMYSVGLALEASNMPVDVAGQEAILKTIASSEDVFYSVTSAAGLQEAFDDFAGEVLMAATNARFVDQMGDSFNLQMGTIKDLDDNVVDGVKNKIEILSYDIWTRADYLAGNVTADKIGDRKETYTVLETITFNADGTEAYSDKDSIGPEGETIAAGGNILIDGVIYANSFWYNNNPAAVEIDGVDIPTGTDSNGLTTGSTNMLPSETFYWKMGTIKTTELAMRYYVYLDGSMEGTKDEGSYATNNFAILYYNNYLNQPIGQPCQKVTMSPTVAWKAANVSYAFYLVNENGEIIVNQTSGETGAFANKIAVTNPVLYKTVRLNNEGNVSSIDIASLGVLPDGYTLYDYNGTNGAKYTVQIDSDNTGSWVITKVKDVKTTYITQYDPNNASAYSNELTNETIGYDYTHTIVWFAVVWKVQALPDSVVVDYGLPVDISVLTNDMFGENGKLAGVGAADANGVTLEGYTSDNKLPQTTYTASYGTVEANIGTGKVRYTPGNMKMNGYDKFAYAVQYTGSENGGYYYDTITVIPATSIYYEDNFLSYSFDEWSNEDNAWVDYTGREFVWTQVANDSKLQDEDRPGKYSLTDANNIYGYDSINLGMSTHSLSGFAKATVDYDHSAVAEFEFYGTGFDIISMTNNTTGTILVDVLDADNNAVKQLVVDTYYGYKAQAGDADGDDTIEEDELVWVVDATNAGSIYSVPVIKVADLTYGKYKVIIRVQYDPIFDHGQNDGKETYDFYLDAVRIYDPANDGAADGTTDTTIEDAYLTDGEGWPSYLELRNGLIDAGTLGNEETGTVVTGLVFIDGDEEVGDAQLVDYKNYGPNNEVYLAPGQQVAFMLSTPANIDNVHIGIKSANGEVATYKITNIAKDDKDKIKTGGEYNTKTYTVNTTTDMYYDLTDWKGDIIVISNAGDLYNTKGILSLTNIKSTYKSDPSATTDFVTDSDNGVATASLDEVPASNETYMYMTPAAATLTLRSLNRSAAVETPEETTTEEETTAEEVTTEEITTTEKATTEEETTTEEVTTEEETTTEEVTTEEETTTEEEPSEETEKFDPEKFSIGLSSKSVKVGNAVVVTVRTGKDVEALSINGKAVENYIENRWTKTRTWVMTVKAEMAGEMDIEVVAYNADDVASEPVIETVTVTAKTQNMFEKIFGWLFG